MATLVTEHDNYPPVVVFRVDASIQIGIGHLVRCLTLANALRERGLIPLFICRDLPGERSDLIKKQGFDFHHLTESSPSSIHFDINNAAYQLEPDWQQDIQNTLTKLSKVTPQAFVIDHYGINTAWESELARNYPGAPLLVIDDLANRPHHCTALLDQTPLREKLDYQHLVPTDCTLWLGNAYSLLRHEFSSPQVPRHPPRQEDAWHILVSLGGSDPENHTLSILRSLEALPSRPKRTEICTIMGRHAPHLPEVASWCQRHQQRLVVDTDRMVEFIDWAHLAIGAGGTSASERCARSLPALVLVMADNQRRVSAALSTLGACINLGECNPFPASRLCHELQTLLLDPEQYQQMVDRCGHIFDGRGTQRAADGLVDLMNNCPLRLFPMTLADMQQLWHWQCEPGNRRFFRHPAAPEWPEHENWFKRAVASPNIKLYRIDWKQSAVGMMRLDMRSTTTAEVSILLSKSTQGQGIGRLALQLFCEQFPQLHLIAEIHPDNQPSKCIFRGCGFTQMDTTHYYRQGCSK